MEVIKINIFTLDELLLCKIYTRCNKTHQLTKFYENLNKFSKPLFLIIYGFYTIQLLLNKNTILPTFILYPFGLLVTNILLRKLFKRKRPFENKNLNLQGLGKSKSFSLPSNHASSSIVISLFISYVTPTIALVILILALITSFSRVARGYHYPLDIACSMLLTVLTFILSTNFPIML